MSGHAIADILDRLEELAGREKASLGEIMAATGGQSVAAALVAPALIVVSPLSGIPLLPTVCGLLIALIGLQLLVGRPGLWLPGPLMRRQVRGERLGRAVVWLDRLGNWLDRHARHRFTALTVPPLALVPQVGAILSGLSMPFLELVPFSSSILGLAVVFFAAGLVVRDGLFVVAGLAMMGLASLIPTVLIDLVSGS